MDSSDWTVLKIINEEHSLTKTAERLFMTQPSLTYRLNRLEKEFGVRILNRNSNGVYFTVQGEYILKYAEEMTIRLNEVRDYVQNMKGSINGTLRLGVSTIFAKLKIAPILKTYHDRFPDVKIILKTGSSTLELPDMLNQNSVDLIIKRGDFDWPEKKHILFEEPHGIISAHPIELSQLPSIPWIQDETIIITRLDKTFCSWWKSKFSKPVPSNIIEVNSIEACIQMVSQGFGWTIIPKIHVANQRCLNFYPLTWPNGQPMLRKTIMAYRNKAAEQPAVKMFIDYMLNEYQIRI